MCAILLNKFIKHTFCKNIKGYYICVRELRQALFVFRRSISAQYYQRSTEGEGAAWKPVNDTMSFSLLFQ